MKKPSHSGFKKVVISAFDFRKWSDFERMKGFTLYLENGIKNLFIPRQQAAKQTFDEALQQYNVNEKDLLKKQNGLLRLSLFMCIVALGFLFYAIYLALFGSWHATLLSIVIMLLALTMAFRYHFWYFQIKQRKLGCTFQEWFQRGFLGKKDK
ncbi:MAG: type IV secretion protein IcmV [Legionellales bacterium RIFCSPHIGHO2_12_FULL_42_9]|nr:MAG: type IV secretion protein IcmV [Legionellales bacterium RIFCSPHIGHO2_12_FULL_42_9]